MSENPVYDADGSSKTERDKREAGERLQGAAAHRLRLAKQYQQ